MKNCKVSALRGHVIEELLNKKTLIRTGSPMKWARTWKDLCPEEIG
jgi:hypothetical protein